MPDDRTALAAEAFIYGFPLVFNLEQVDRSVREGIGALPAAPMNQFSHATQLAGPRDTFVSINNDTVYSIAQVDVSGGPVRLEVPDADGRYYVLQFVDAWTDNFAYVGHRATGTGRQSYLLVAPDWEGEEPGDAQVVRFPTAVGSIVGRWAVADKDDLPAVRELQSQLTLSPQGDGYAGPATPDAGVPEDLAFFERLRAWCQAFPPAARDLAYQERFRPLGLFEAALAVDDEALAADLRAGLVAGREKMEYALEHGDSPEQNGWRLTYHAFDYNLDFFGVGTLDEDRWKIEDPKVRYPARALAARGGLWGNHGYEAAYAMVYVDGERAPLDGSRRYRLRFPTEPPCGAFWSVTMYDMPDFFLVANPIERYSIGDRTAGLRRGEDGSLTIYMQPEEPEEPEARANWLPTPAGRFRPLLRVYEPEDAIFDGGYELPPIERLA
ncbi:MAG: DUF1254 domain-containing protein [Actinobacteria bacterium]|nr:DUF1254 domain-containing protein [Actinomycetota bacterium]